MYAIFKDSGRQFKVKEGDVILIDGKELPEGEEIQFDRVLFVDGKIGLPLVDGARVTGVVRGRAMGPKIYVQKFKRRKKYRRRTGHRQRYTKIEIKSIEA